jgi:ABC-2 type transport system ATP-binding protein
VLEVRELRKAYGTVQALRGVDLDVAAGEIVGLLGPNGAGKTSLVSIVAGLRRPDAGQVRVDGGDPTDRQVRRAIGLAPQELGIYSPLTVRQNLELMADLALLRGAARTARVEQVAELFALGPLLGRTCSRTSGGEKRRLHSAMALIHAPRLVLLDEPTTGVDVRTRTQVLDAVRDLAAQGAAVCYSTHYLPEVEALGASVCVLEHGTVVARGTVAELVAQHGGSAVQLRFRATAPEVPAGWEGTRDREVLTLRCVDPAAQAPSALAAVGPAREELVAMEILRPSLESVFLAVTGRRYSEDPGATPDVEADDLEDPRAVPAP